MAIYKFSLAGQIDSDNPGSIAKVVDNFLDQTEVEPAVAIAGLIMVALSIAEEYRSDESQSAEEFLISGLQELADAKRAGENIEPATVAVARAAVAVKNNIGNEPSTFTDAGCTCDACTLARAAYPSMVMLNRHDGRSN